MKRIKLQCRDEDSRRRDSETKTYDAAASNVIDISTAGSVSPTPFGPISSAGAFVLNQVPQGTDSLTRVGRRIRILSLEISMSLLYNFAVAAGGNLSVYRACLVLDKSPNKGTVMPAFTDIFTNVDACSLPLVTGRDRFTILRQWQVTAVLTAGASAWLDSKANYVQEKLVFDGGIMTVWAADGASGLYSNMMSGALMLYCSNGVPGSASAQVSTRIEFEDV